MDEQESSEVWAERMNDLTAVLEEIKDDGILTEKEVLDEVRRVFHLSH